MEITREQFQQYRNVQDEGMFNMFDPMPECVQT